MTEKKLGTIVFIIDERISRERGQIVMRAINALRHQSNLILMSASTTEADLLKKLEEQTVNLVLVPWHRYLAWSRVEAFYGLTRTSGPAFAGYFADSIKPYEIGPQAEHSRAIFLDFANISTAEILNLVKSLVHDNRRTGLRPLLDTQTPIYCENWFGAQGLGTRIDSIFGLPEIMNSEWIPRSNALRIALSSLWSLVYEEGPGKGEFAQTITAKSPKAYFQIGVCKHMLALRLCYSMNAWSPKAALAVFWPDAERPTSPAQLLLKYADLVRVHVIPEAGDVEVTVGFMPSAPAEAASGSMRTLWVEPIAAQMVSEIPFEAPGPQAPLLKALPSPAQPAAERVAARAVESLKDEVGAKDRFIFEAAVKIRELRRLVAERDETIRELRSGGVGTAPPLPPPDAEALLEAFQDRYFEARFQIRQLELEIADAEAGRSSPEKLQNIRQKIQALMNREQAWIQKIGSTLEMVKQERKKG